MPALNFQARFAPLVESGEKCQTIRKRRKDGRDPKPGDTLYLYTGQRTSRCRKLGEGTCTEIFRIFIYSNGELELVEKPGQEPTRLLYSEAGDLAKRDGFPAPHMLIRWFDKVHGLPFEGLVIRWEKK